jgi:phospholipid/cholesterol/gamma-HCH transport system substrate-binding protein
VLKILAGENHVLAKLAVDSDKALAPFAKVRGQVADFITQSNTVAQAGAATRGSLARNLQLFPSFLEKLGPALERVQRFAEQTTPTFTALKAAAPGIDKTFTSLPAFGASNEKFFANLGKTAKVSGPALNAFRPLLKQLSGLGNSALPFTKNFSELLTSLRNTGGLERIMDFIFLGTGAANGYDALGHFLRVEAAASACVGYEVELSGKANCRRKLFNDKGSASEASAARVSAASSSSGEGSPSVLIARTLAVMKGATPAQAIAKYPGSISSAGEVSAAGLASGSTATTAPVGGSTSGTTYYTPTAEGAEAGGLLLNYLLGSE